MAEWKEEINLSHLFRLYEVGKIGVAQLSKATCERLKTIKYYSDEYPEFLDITIEFEDIDDIGELDDYNHALDMLYDFGDQQNRLWIEVELSVADIAKEAAKNDNKITNLEAALNQGLNQLSFENKLKLHNINPAHLSPVMYTFLRGALPYYQDKLLARWNEESSGFVNEKKKIQRTL